MGGRQGQTGRKGLSRCFRVTSNVAQLSPKFHVFTGASLTRSAMVVSGARHRDGAAAHTGPFPAPPSAGRGPGGLTLSTFQIRSTCRYRLQSPWVPLPRTDFCCNWKLYVLYFCTPSPHFSIPPATPTSGNHHSFPYQGACFAFIFIHLFLNYYCYYVFAF